MNGDKSQRVTFSATNFFHLMVCKDFCPNTERKFTKTVKDKVKCFNLSWM